MPSPFSPSRALGIPPKDYAAYFDDEVPAFNPDRGYSASPSMVTTFDPFASQMGEFEAQRDLSALDAQKDILSGQTDWLSPEGRQKRLDYTLQGVISPQQDYAIDRMTAPPKTPAITKYSAVPAEVAKAAAELDYIDPTDPKAWEDVTKILRTVDEHPEWGGSNLKTHPHFSDKVAALKRDILAHRTHQGSAVNHDQSAILNALKSGASIEDIQPYLDPSGERIADRMGFMSAQSQAARRKEILTPKTKDKLNELKTSALAAAESQPSIPAKEAWLTANGVDPNEATSEQWSQAYDAVRNGPMRDYLLYLKGLGLEQPQQGQPTAPTFPSIPRKAIELLQGRPDLAPLFDQKYGPGAAAKILH